MSWSDLPRTLLTCLLAAGLLGACGFRPLYKQTDNTDTVREFSQISIAQPEDRPSQQLRNYLLDALTPYGQPDRPVYRLDFRITESVGSVFVTRSEEITRNNLQVTASAYLRDYQSGSSLFSVSASSQASYNVTQADYANLVSEKNARERALRDVAEQIRLRLGNYFDRKPEIERRKLEQQRLPQ
ncbi:MAG: LPS assembly lipoprotein LptE [Ferrovibrio sp.]